MADPFDEFEKSLEAGGLQCGLQHLNLRVGHRFTAIYRLDDMELHNMALVDKVPDGFDTAALQTLPLGDSFCQFVLRDGFFRTSQTTGMDMLNGHPYQSVLESYVGLPIMKTPDVMYGTLCHFDFGSEEVSDDEFEFLKRVARVLPRYL